MSLDGYSAGPNQSVDHPLGVGGTGLMEWFFPTRTFQRMHNRASRGTVGLEVMTEAVFTPLGMTGSSYVWRPDFDALTATGYNSDGKPTEA
jgi:hypothetical protein